MKNKLLSITEELPDSLRTLLRAQLLIHLNRLAPTNVKHFESIGFTKTTVRKILREFIVDDMVYEKYFLYYMTDKGKEMIEKLDKDPLVVSWKSLLNWNKTGENGKLSRPKVYKLE